MLTDLIGDYQNSAPRCLRKDGRAFHCDAMVLGALIKSSMSIGLWPPPAPPFTGVSFCHLSGQIQQMNVPTLCEIKLADIRNRCLPFRESIEAPLKSLEDQLCGLDFSAFKA